MRINASGVLFALAVGIAAAVIRMACVFFSWLNVADVLVFAAAGYLVGRRSSNTWWVSSTLIIVPSVAIILFGLTSIGLEHLREGVGVSHVYALVLLPLSAGVGALLGAKRSVHSAAA